MATEGRGTAAGSGSGIVRRMVRERTEQLLTQWRAALAGPWDPEVMGLILGSLNQLTEGAAKFALETVAAAARESAASLGSLLDGGLAPNDAQRARLGNYIERLNQAAVALADVPTEDASIERSAVLYVRAPEQSIQGLEAALRGRNLVPLVADAPTAVAAAVQGHSLVGVVVDSSLLGQLGEIIDALDQARRAGPTPPLLVVTQDPTVAQQLMGMTGSADAFVPNADAAGVVRKLEDLQRALSSSEPLRVLIVDDDRSQTLFCDAVLRRRGIQTLVAASSREALERVPTFRPDLILVDLYMPDIDGMALTARVRDMPDTMLMAIVFMSGEQDVGKRVAAINIGGDDFLTKPIRPGHLIDVVVGRAKRARALRRQVIGSPAEATAGPLARSVLALRIRNLADRPAALISVGLENGEQLAQKLPALVRCEIEQALAGRIAARVQPGDAFGPWQDFHFLVMAARPSARHLQQLAHSFKSGIDVRPVVISRGQIKVNARIQMTAAEGDPQRWLEQALNSWTRAHGSAPAFGMPSTPTTASRPEPSPNPDSFLVEDHSVDSVALRPDASLCAVEYQPLVLVRGVIAGQWHQRLRLRHAPGTAPQLRRSDILEPARRAGTLAEFDRIAIRLALETLVAQRRQGRLLRIFLEVDVDTVIEAGFADTLEAQIAASMLREADLTLELDTDATIAQLPVLRNVLARLRKIGVHTCLRHFGLQREAPRLLQMVNIDVVKLDTDLALQAQLSFQSLIAQIRDNGVPMAVEGVPDRHAIAQLWNLGIDYIQCDLLRPHGASFDYDFQATEM